MQTIPQHRPARPVLLTPANVEPKGSGDGARPAPAGPPAVLPSAFELEPHLEALCDMATD